MNEFRFFLSTELTELQFELKSQCIYLFFLDYKLTGADSHKDT